MFFEVWNCAQRRLRVYFKGMKIGILHFKKRIRSRLGKAFTLTELRAGFKGVYGIADEIFGSNAIIPFYPDDPVAIDILLISLMGYHDVFNLLKFVPAKLPVPTIVGGPACWNIRPFKHVIDKAVFGRSEGIINSVLNGKPSVHVWSQERDPDLQLQYQVRGPVYAVGDEKSAGCSKRCYFCRYGWTCRPSLNFKGYTGHAPFNELFLADINWHAKKNKRIVTGLDGLSEETRFRVNKRITDEQFICKIKEFYTAGPGNYQVKLYIIIGYPWETVESVLRDVKHIIRMLTKIDFPSASRLQIYLHFNHFVPSSLTPMELCAFNLNFFHPHLGRNGWKWYKGKSIEIYGIPTSASLMQSFEMLLCDRAFEGDFQRWPTSLLTRHINNYSTGKRLRLLSPIIASGITKRHHGSNLLATNYIKRGFSTHFLEF